MRPVEGLYPAAHRCWAYKGADYMVCESCFKSGKAQHLDKLVLQPNAEAESGAEAPTGEPAPAENDNMAVVAEVEKPAVVDEVEVVVTQPAAEQAAVPPQQEQQQRSVSPEFTDMETELARLKAKHNASSRLEACLKELGEQREENVKMKAELEETKERLASAVARAEAAEAK